MTTAAQMTTAAKTNIDAMFKHGNGADHLASAGKANTEALAKSGNAAAASFQELAKAYQAIATKNTEKMTSSIQALTSAKTPSEFVELQKKLMTESIETAASDWSNLAKLTVAVFTATFEPMQKQAEALRDMAAK